MTVEQVLRQPHVNNVMQQQQAPDPAYLNRPSAAAIGTDSQAPAAAQAAQQHKEQQRQPQQQQQQQPAPAGQDGQAARHVKVHLARPAVRRSILHHLARAFGVQLRGDVATNEVSTAKYTLLTFLPVNLFEQFLRVANLYFLLMAILQLIPGLSPTSWFTTVAPLVFVLAVNAIKEGYDDVHRHRNDSQVNNRKVILLTADAGRHHHGSAPGSRRQSQGSRRQSDQHSSSPGSQSKEQLSEGQQLIFWKDVVAGDLIMVRADEEVPADLLLLSANDPDDLCYVETANLDGETNLKIKYCWNGYTHPGPAVEGGQKLPPKQQVMEFQQLAENCTIGLEAPNAKLYTFDGYVEDSKGKRPLVIDNLLLRGSVLRKTEWVIGVALNVGADSKIVRNMTKAPRKVTQLERAMNVLVFLQFGFLLLFSAVLAGLDQWWAVNNAYPKVWYLKSVNQYPELPPSVGAFFIAFLRFLILLSNMIPISLYVSLEVVKVFQCALLLNSDRKMYHKDSDTPFVCRTTTLNEELGQVQYVLSDKTGTLTQNVMGFVWASINGKLYGACKDPEGRPKGREGVPGNTPHTIALDPGICKALGIGVGDRAKASDKPRDTQVANFFMALAVCNVVVPSPNPEKEGELMYQASSPDEEALVQGAAYLGFKLTFRTTEQVKVVVDQRTEATPLQYTFDILATLEFSSDRKRMSVIVRTPDNKLLLYCKGADNVILSRLAEGEPGVQTVKEHLGEMSRQGYRTLLVAWREISVQEYEEWQDSYNAASVAMVDREARMACEQDKIERELHLLGATAVEDKLQDGVPDCLQQLGRAGINVWVLTGDKVETAISIAFSCKLFTDDMGVVEFRESDCQNAVSVEDRRRVIRSKLQEVIKVNKAKHAVSSHCGIVIEGSVLTLLLDPELQDDLMELCKQCKAVVCCRVSPMQKAQITNMVKKKAGAITLAIGDGANDVGMIRAAHIGVGISGREGRAAVLSSDFSFAQFRYLSRLLLLHGRWSYLRNLEVVLYSFYKNWAYVLVYVYLQFVAGYSAVPIFTTMMISTFNMIFTACPIVAYAVLEQDLEKETILSHPETYNVTRTMTKQSFFRRFALWILAGTWHSLPVYFLPWYTLVTPDRNGRGQDLSGTGTAVFIALTFAVALKLCTRTHAWSWITHLVYWLSLAVLFPFVYVVSILWPQTAVSGVSDMSGTGAWLFSNPVFWLTALLGAPAIALLPDLAIMIFRREFQPDLATLLQATSAVAGGCCLVALVSMQEQEVLQYLSAKRMRDTGQQGVFSDKARAVPRGSDGGADEPVLGSGKELGGLEMAAAAAGSPRAYGKKG